MIINSAENYLSQKIDTFTKPINLSGSPIDSNDVMPSNYVVCLDNVCCVTQCWTENGKTKCYTICVQKTGEVGHQFHKYT